MTGKAGGQNGSRLLIKVGNGGAPETFSTIGGLRSSQIVLNNHPLDSTNLESGAWRQLLPGSGIQSLIISGTGIFLNSATEETVRGYAFATSANNYKLIFSSGSYVSGAFIVTEYERGGNYDGEEIYSLTLESAGTIAFAAS